MCYVDDVVIATPTLEDHIDRLDEVFGCMKRAGLKCKPSKCEILRDSIKYLGRMVDRHGVRPDPEAVEAVLTWKAPRTDTQLMSFLGFANYYREFIKGYADKVYPMQKLMRNKGKKFEWNDEAQVAFENIKRELCEAPVLGMPTEKVYVLDTDASVVAISGILQQEQEWNGRTVLRPIAYGSKVLSDTEMKYGAPKAEMFAVVTFVEKYRAYLGSAPFKLRVDNRALSWLKTYSMDQSYIGRWIVRLDGYHMIIEHRMRDKHQNADSLSKNVLDTDASVVAISGILQQEQEWNGRTVLRPIAYVSKVLSDTEMKYGAPKAEMFAVVTFVEKYRAYLGSAPFKLRVDNRALSWLKTYSIDQSYIGRWIVRLDGYHMIIEHRMRDKHQNADSLSKKTELYERLEQKQANQAK